MKMGVLVTSRDEPDIVDALHNIDARMRMENCQAEMEIDIKSYINHHLETDAKFKYVSSSVKADIKSSLNEKCAVM